MSILNKQTHFVASSEKKLLVGFILGLFLSFIIIFLQPFDTNNYNPKGNKTLILTGFGLLLFGTYVIYSFIENFWYKKLNKVWLIRHEIVSVILFFLLAGSVIYLYNRSYINGFDYSLESYYKYLKNIVLFLIPIVAPVLIFLRYKFGERIILPSKNEISILGENKNEYLKLEKQQLLFIKAVENYIEIVFIDSNFNKKSVTFRQTLSNANLQLPFLKKCHRSYLVNRNLVEKIHGNSQNAKLSFKNVDEKIPLSKTYYKNFKSELNT